MFLSMLIADTVCISPPGFIDVIGALAVDMALALVDRVLRPAIIEVKVAWASTTCPAWPLRTGYRACEPRLDDRLTER
jgi:hypothetical protein